MCNCSGFQFCGDCARSSQCAAALPGLDGVNGKTILSGTTDPNSSIGTDGDFYISKVSPFKFFHKESGQWVYIGNLQGVNGNGFLAIQEVTLTQSEIQNLNTTPVEVLPSLPSNYVYTIPDAIVILDWNGNTWSTSGGYLSLRYKTATSYQIAQWGPAVLGSSSDKVARGTAWNNFSGNNIPLGSGVEIYHSTTNPSGNGGIVKIKLVYQIWSV